MQQRLGIADALVKDPEVLILDEPTIAIDPRGVAELLALIRRLRDEHGVTVLLSSHLLHQVQEVCDRVGIFVGGRLVAAGTIDELGRQLSGGRQTLEVAVDGALDRARCVVESRLADVEVTHEDGLLIVSAPGDPRRVLSRALQAEALPVTHLRVRAGGPSRARSSRRTWPGCPRCSCGCSRSSGRGRPSPS